MTAETKGRRKRRPLIALPDELKSVCCRLLVPDCAMVAGGFEWISCVDNLLIILPPLRSGRTRGTKPTASRRLSPGISTT
jgi:hypothetical protein